MDQLSMCNQYQMGKLYRGIQKVVYMAVEQVHVKTALAFVVEPVSCSVHWLLVVGD